MKIYCLFGLVFFSIAQKCCAQSYRVYSYDSLFIESEYLQESIYLNLHLPESYVFSDSSFKYPITIIFDSHHERTYPQIINSFDLLTGETQIPGLTHIFSLASYYAQQKNEYKTAIDFLEMGICYYPLYVPLYIEIIEYHQILK